MLVRRGRTPPRKEDPLTRTRTLLGFMRLAISELVHGRAVPEVHTLDEFLGGAALKREVAWILAHGGIVDLPADWPEENPWRSSITR